MIDYDFENRLVERIAARELIAAANLNPRQKRVLRQRSHGDVFAEIGRCEGVSGACAQQIYHRSIEKVRAARWPQLELRPELQRRPAPGFNKAEFLDHMRFLIVQREANKRSLFDNELATLEHMLRREFEPPKLAPPAITELLAAQAAAEQRRREAAAREARFRAELYHLGAAEFYHQERLEWTGCLLSAIVECEGTPYAVLIPQMRADIANIESQPPGALLWRFDRTAFKQHFEAYKAKVGVPHV